MRGEEALMSEYDARSIEVLEGLDPVRNARDALGRRVRPLHHLVYEVVDNSIDEAVAGFCDTIRVTIHSDNSVTVEDNGRGIPGRSPRQARASRGRGRADDAALGREVQQQGVQGLERSARRGRLCVNALSDKLDLEIKLGGKVYRQRYERGVPQEDLHSVGTTDKTGTTITFHPDPTIFDITEYSFDTLANRLRELSFLNAGIRIHLEDERSGKKHDFHYEGGIASFVEYLNRGTVAVHPVILLDRRPPLRAVHRRRHRHDGRAHRGRAPVQRRIQRERLQLRQQREHDRGRRSAPDRLPQRDDARDESLDRGAPAREGGRHRHRRGHARGPRRGRFREALAPAVRGPDEGQARQQRGHGAGREPGLRAALSAASRRTRPSRRPSP